MKLQARKIGTDTWLTLRTHGHGDEAAQREYLTQQQRQWQQSMVFPNHEWRIQ